MQKQEASFLFRFGALAVTKAKIKMLSFALSLLYMFINKNLKYTFSVSHFFFSILFMFAFFDKLLLIPSSSLIIVVS